MRCLALADALKAEGWKTAFALRSGTKEMLPGSVIKGHDELLLETHFEDTALLKTFRPNGIDLFVVDHYGLGADFETTSRELAKLVLVIDDMPNREHNCDILVDQTPGREEKDYRPLLPDNCQIFSGAEFALLRPEFSRLRDKSLERRNYDRPLKRVLVSMGGGNGNHLSEMVINGIAESALPVSIDLVLNPGNRHLSNLQKQIAELRLDAEIHVGTDRMAELMVEADLAIGAAGVTSLERCCLGLPSITIVCAENQVDIANSLKKNEVASVLGHHDEIDIHLISETLVKLSNSPHSLSEMANKAAALCDGEGIANIVQALPK